MNPSLRASLMLAAALSITGATVTHALPLPHLPHLGGAQAQAPAALPKLAPGQWAQAKSDVAPDPNVRFGALPNGMRYAIERQAIPAEYLTVTKQVAEGASHMEWRRILCETNVTPAIVSDIQTALNAKGFKAGDATGSFNAQTLKALESFQVANNLPQGGVTIESLNALGVKY